jgi:ABC-2 type transport system ATP-binding protein
VQSSRTERLREIPGVSEVREDREAVELNVIEAEPVLRVLLARDSTLSGLEVTSAGLEEAFLTLTQDASNNGTRPN